MASDSKTHIVVIDYGMGNLHSVASALKYVAPQAEVEVSSDPARALVADRIIFPGVGAIRDCVAEIRKLNFDRTVRELIGSGKPVLAICVGLQALMTNSEENGGVECLNFFKGSVKYFGSDPAFERATDEGSSSGEHLKVPHMGWNQVNQKVDHPLWQGIDNLSRFYFVHSFCVQAEEQENIVGTCHYGIEFSAALATGNVFAAQFHPEKSAANGLKLLSNFVDWSGRA